MAKRRSSRPQPGAAVLRQLAKTLEGGWPPGLTVLTGEDRFHLDAAQQRLLKHLAPEEGGMGLTVLGSESKVSPAELVAAARSSAMFAPRRVVLLRDVANLEGDPAPLVDYAGSPPADSYVLVRALKLDLRRPLHKALYCAGTRLEFPPPEAVPASELVREVSLMATELDLRLERGVAELLVDIADGDLYRARSELEKLAAWCGAQAQRRVGVEQASQLVAGEGSLSGWEVADAVLERDLGAALGAVRRLVEAGEEPIRLVGGLAWRARTLLQAKALLEQRVAPERVVSAARAWSYRERFLRGLSRYSLRELLGFPAALLAADRALKSRSIDPAAVLEHLVRTLIGPAKERA